jgi:hypothetical protein
VGKMSQEDLTTSKLKKFVIEVDENEPCERWDATNACCKLGSRTNWRCQGDLIKRPEWCSLQELDPLDPITLAIDMFEECDRWAVMALGKYIHKAHMFETELSVDTVYQHQQKIRIVLAKLQELR